MRLLSIILAIVLCSCSSQEQGQTLVVGTNAEFAPFAFIENGVLKGFEIDIAETIASRMGYAIQWKDLPFEALIPALQLSQVDFVAAGMSITEEREKVVGFSKPYLDGEPLVALYDSKKIEAFQPEKLASYAVVVNQGYTAETYVIDILGVDALRLGNPAEALLALNSGRADVFVTAKNTIQPLISQAAHYTWTEIGEPAENCALMFPKNKPELQRHIDTILTEMQEDGTVEQLKAKWGLS